MTSQSHQNQSPAVTSAETQTALSKKMRGIDRQGKEQRTHQQANQQNLGYVNLQNVVIAPETLILIPEDQARADRIVCFFHQPYTELRLAVSQPLSRQHTLLQQELSQSTHTNAKIYLATTESINDALSQYEKIPRPRETKNEVAVSGENIKQFTNLQNFAVFDKELKRQSDVSQRLNLIIAAALEFNASDIHLEATETKLVIRLRVDGILYEVAELDKNDSQTLFSRLKLVAGLKLNITNKPQDGHFIIRQAGGKIDVRVSSVPTNFGESIVLRILRSDVTRLKIGELGFLSYTLKLVEQEVKRPNGLLVTCGPTGSGKTTTLYSLLNQINTPANKILTVEDPIEYELPGINQSQVNPEQGYTFANGLKSLLRQDPDVILIGEMRDEETVTISINAALTGHLVLSTLHTNNAAGAIPRFLSMSAKAYLLAPALNTVIAQRLVRKLCPHCKKEIDIPADQKNNVEKILEQLPDKVKHELSQTKTFYGAVGCGQCRGLGYSGRIGIFEIFTNTDKTKELILKGGLSEISLQQELVKQGMITLAQDGIIKTIKGITSLEEVMRVVEIN